MKEGFLGSKKLKVRLLESEETAAAVASARRGEPVIVRVDAQRLAKEGRTFGRAANGEILVDRFGPEYCSEVPLPSGPRLP